MICCVHTRLYHIIAAIYKYCAISPLYFMFIIEISQAQYRCDYKDVLTSYHVRCPMLRKNTHRRETNKRC